MLLSWAQGSNSSEPAQTKTEIRDFYPLRLAKRVRLKQPAGGGQFGGNWQCSVANHLNLLQNLAFARAQSENFNSRVSAWKRLQP
jgi:hypothetical protein